MKRGEIIETVCKRRFGQYLVDDESQWPDRYRLEGSVAVAWKVIGWQATEDEDTEWTGQYVATGDLVVCMVGDDHYELAEPDELQPIDDLAYCTECGQIGCCHDGRDR